MFAIDDTEDSDATNKHDKDNPSNNNTGSELSEKQINRLYALAHACNFDNDKIKSMVKTKFNKEIVGLTKAEYKHICDGLQSKLDNQGA